MFGSSSRASSWLNWAQQPREAGGLGLAPHQAAGLVGNLVNESGQDLNPWGPTGDNGTAWGTAQWRGDRLNGLKQYAAQNGLDYRSMEAQQGWMRHEMDTSENGAYKALLSAQSPEQAAAAVDANYERSDGSTRSQRMAAARQLMAQFGGGGDDTSSPGALTSAFAPTESKSSMPSPALSADQTLGQGALGQDDQKGLLGLPQMSDNTYSSLMGIASSLAGISNPDQAKALMAQVQLGKKAQGTWSTQIMPNGQIMMTNSQGGPPKILGKPGDYSKDDTYTPVHYYDQASGQMVDKVFNKNTGQYVDGGQGTAPSGPPLGGDPNLTGQDRYNSLSPEDQRTIDAWHEGTGINPSSYATKNPRIAKLMDAAQAVYGPEMDFSKYGERQNFAKGYANKSPMAFGGQIIGTDHTANQIGQAADLMLGLGNHSGGWGGYGQTLANKYEDAVGGPTHDNQRSNTIGQLKNKADTLSTEFQTLMTRGKGGGQHEREEKASEIFQPDAAPEVQAASLQSMLDSLKARHEEYVQAAMTNGGQSWLDRHPDVDKKVRDTIDATQAKIDKLYKLNKGDKTTAAPAATAIDHNAIDAELKRRGL